MNTPFYRGQVSKVPENMIWITALIYLLASISGEVYYYLTSASALLPGYRQWKGKHGPCPG